MRAREFILNRISEKVNRTDSRELIIFDIDDTLLHTTAKINVVKDGEVIRSLSNQEFNNYKLGPGEDYDFGEFRNARKFEEESVPIGPMLDKLRGDLAAGKNVVMLTARADFDDQKTVWRTFKRHGIDINKDVHLFRAGNQPGGGSPAIKKAIHVREWLQTGKFDRIVMYDDSEKNLSVFKSLQKEFPKVDFEAHHVNDVGDTKKFEDIELNELNVAQTLKFIKQAHGDQLYGKLPYWRHPRAVALTGRKVFGSKFTSDAVKTAFLHDVVEDTDVGLDELSKLDFSPKVIQAVGLLTKDQRLTYRQNIERIIASGNVLAMMVKYADNYENYTGDKSDWDPAKASSSQKKYLMSLNMLGDALGVKHHIDEGKRKKRKKRWAAYGPGPYGGYGYAVGYSGDGGAAAPAGDGGGVGEDQHPNDRPVGPEFKPTMPKGTVRVDVSDVYDWYKLGQHIANLKGLGKHDFGKGPPATILSFGSEKEEHEFIQALKQVGLDITDIDPAYHDKKKGVKTDPTYNVENFADGKKPGRKGLAKRSGVNCKASVSTLRSVAKNSSGEKQRMAHWCANMKSGRNK